MRTWHHATAGHEIDRGPTDLFVAAPFQERLYEKEQRRVLDRICSGSMRVEFPCHPDLPAPAELRPRGGDRHLRATAPEPEGQLLQRRERECGINGFRS